MSAPKDPSATCRARFGPSRQRPREYSCGGVNIPETEKGNDVPPESLILIVKWVETVWHKQFFVQKPPIQSTSFVGISDYELVHVREVVEEHG